MSGAGDRPALLTDEQVQQIRGRAKGQRHFRAGPGRCCCGFDAYEISGFMIDYHEELQGHLRRNRDSPPVVRIADIAALLADRDALVLRVVELSQQVADLENAWGTSGDDD